MSEKLGFFIVLEGIDGAGTTTQAGELHRHLKNQGFQSHLTNEPTSGPVGRLIREALSGQVMADGSGEGRRFAEATQCLLFAADRIEHSVSIERQRAAGIHVVCDRYVHSSIAYQSIDPSMTPERVVEVNRGISVPDLTLFVDVPVDECLRRLGNRDDAPSIYEKKELLVKIDANYRATMPLYQQHYGRVVPIDGTNPVEAVASDIAATVRTHLQA